MPMSRTLKQAVHLALALGGASAAIPFASAQQAPGSAPVAIQEVTVTGSRLRRVDAETASPVFVLDSEAISESGVNTIGDLVQRIPAIAGLAINPQVNNGGGYGESNIELRGLGAVRTLILLDGRRVNLAGASGGVDVNMIPVSAIERVEVLKEGAGAVYGSDAIGGVVNFILKKNFEGVELNADYGRTSRSDGGNHSEGLLIGSSADKFSFMAGGSYTKLDAVQAGARDFSKVSLAYYSGSVVTGGSSRRPQGRYFLPSGSALRTQFGCSSVTRKDGAAGSSLADYRCYHGATDAFNFQPYNLLLTPQERGAVFTIATYKFSDTLEAYSEVLYNRTHSGFQIAPLPFDTASDNVVISAQSYYNPFSIGFGGQTTGFANATTRTISLGDRAADTTSDSKMVTAGFRGQLPSTDWNFDLNFNYGRLDQTAGTGGYLFKPSLTGAFGPSFMNAQGVVQCGTAASPISLTSCTPVNFFNLTDPAQITALKTISAGFVNQNIYSSKTGSLDVSGKIFTLPAGPAQAAIGISYNAQFGNFQPSFVDTATPPTYVSCQLAQETCTSPTNGGYNVKEVYGEVLVPLLKDLPAVHALDVSGGIRYSNYSTFGSTTKGQLRVQYRPIADVLVRGSYAQVFRSPTINDLYAGAANNAPTFNDPCNGLTVAKLAANANLAKICQFVPTDGSYQQANGQTSGLITGNPLLKPETGTVLTYGVVYDSSQLKGFSASADIWHYKLDNQIVTLDPNFASTQCVATGAPEFCRLFTRFASSGQIFYVNQPTFNLGQLKTNGIDLGLKYALRNTPAGSFNFLVDLTRIQSYESTPAPGSVPQEEVGTYTNQYGNFAKIRGLAGIGWSMKDFNALLSVRYIGKIIVPNYDGGTPVAGADPNLHISAQEYIDLALGYTFKTKTTVRLIGTNVGDKQPPILYANNTVNANTDVSTYDNLGRRYMVTFTQMF